MSIWRGLLASALGVLFAIGLQIYLLYHGRMPHYTFLTSKTGIAAEKQLLLEYFLWLPWHVTNFQRVDYFRQTGYPQEHEPDVLQFLLLLHSLFFVIGAFIAVILSGGEQKTEKGELCRIKWKSISLPPWRSLFFTLQGNPPPWVLYTLLTLVMHLILMGAATTHYTGPGGPAWLYPLPIVFFVFGTGIGVSSYVVQVIYTSLR